MRRFLLLACLAAAVLVAPACAADTPEAPAVLAPDRPERSGLLPIEGVDYYYEQHGQGEPLLLLHGGLGAGSMFGRVLDALARTHTVILVDLQGHGPTALGERPFTLQAMGDDMAALVQRLGYRQVDVMGYSLGGGVALRMAIQKPQQVRRLVLVSTSYSNDALYPAMQEQQHAVDGKAADMIKGTPMYKTYMVVAPRPQDFPRLLDAIGGFMSKPFDWSADVPGPHGPVMLVYGDSDMFRPERQIAFYQLLGGGRQDGGWQREHMSKNRLAILPDLTHYEIFASPRLAETVEPFLAGSSDATFWSGTAGEAKR